MISISFPEVFSFIERPDEALRVLEQTVDAILRRPRRIFFNQKRCKLVDLCAASVLNALVKNGRRVYPRTRHSGRMPDDPEADEIVRATGLPKALGAVPAAFTPRDFLHFELQEGRKNPGRASFGSDRNRLTTRLTIYVNRCLQRFGVALSDHGAEYFATLVGEVIDNAEQHSARNEWWVAGYLRVREGATVGDCHLVIFNLGLAISESLQQLPQDAVLRAAIDKLVHRHSKRFFRPDVQWSREDLWTLMALQQGVSRKNIQRAHEPLKDRGQGTVDMITMFQHLGERKDGRDKPAMAIVSGSTYIRFDKTYPMREMPDPSGGVPRKIIAFNHENSLERPPDGKYVHSLARFFPGTVISLRFFLDQAHLTEVHRDGDRS